MSCDSCRTREPHAPILTRYRCACGAIFTSKYRRLSCDACRLKRRRKRCPLRQPSPEARWRISEQLRAFMATHGRRPTISELGFGLRPRKRPELPCYTTLQNYFGSYEAALQAADTMPRQHNEGFTMPTRRPTPPRESMTTSSRIECGHDRYHSVRMIHERHYGVTTGRMIAWCYDCQREVPPMKAYA
jgi:hypothetical protein